MKPNAPQPSRNLGIDVARGLAVLIMIETHAYDGWVGPAGKETYAYHLTRRTRGLPLWFSLAASLAIQTAEVIKAAPQLELIREPDVGLVLFRRLGWKREDYGAWAQRLHEDQVAFIPTTKWGVRPSPGSRSCIPTPA